MNSGLYACAGASATASAAACANRFEEPITKRSNVYFGFVTITSRESFSPNDGEADGGVGSSRTRNAIRSSPPNASLAAERRKARKCSSIHSRVKSFGTTIVKTPSPSPPASAWPNQVWNVVSLRVSLSLPETPCQRRSAVISVAACTRLRAPLSLPQGGEHSSVDRPAQRPSIHTLRCQKTSGLQGKPSSPHHSPHLWKPLRNPLDRTTPDARVQRFRPDSAAR